MNAIKIFLLKVWLEFKDDWETGKKNRRLNKEIRKKNRAIRLAQKEADANNRMYYVFKRSGTYQYISSRELNRHKTNKHACESLNHYRLLQEAIYVAYPERKPKKRKKK